MSSKLKSILKYLALLALTALLLWLSIRSIPAVDGESKLSYLWNTWSMANKWYLWAMAVTVMISHILRAYRWQMLIAPTGYTISLVSSFLSLMTGYLVNLAVPRGGEISRCYNLLKLEKTPVEISFGTVVVERIVDLISLVLLIAMSFFVEWNKLKVFIISLGLFEGGGRNIPWWLWAVLGLLTVVMILIYNFKRNEKVKKIIAGFKQGLLAVFALKNKSLFIVLSLLIWGLYFMMSYFVIVAFPETEQLGFRAVLTLFAIGSIAMAAPLPGGAGSYHTLVPLGLVMLYNMPKPDAIAFVFIFHAWQTLIMMVAGAISLLVSYWIIGKKK